jgi:hypothetical protein
MSIRTTAIGATALPTPRDGHPPLSAAMVVGRPTGYFMGRGQILKSRRFKPPRTPCSVPGGGWR